MDPEAEGKLAFAGYIGCAVFVILGLIFAGAIFTAFKNLLTRGQFTTNTRELDVRDHINDPSYFTNRARMARIVLAKSNIATDSTKSFDGVSTSTTVTLTFTYANDSNTDHRVYISRAWISVETATGVSLVMADCDSGAGLEIKVPAHSTAQAGECVIISDKLTRTPTIAKRPHLIAIDNLPVAGGPLNTPWKCIMSANGGDEDIKFYNNC